MHQSFRVVPFYQIVQARSEKIAREEGKCQVMAENAQHDLDEALPALAEATKALESLNKKDMTEIKSYGRPPALVEKVMEAVMILRGAEPTWAESKRQWGAYVHEDHVPEHCVLNRNERSCRNCMKPEWSSITK